MALLILGSVLALPATASVGGSPDLSVSVADNRLDPGDATDVELSIQNRGELNYSSDSQIDGRATTARGVTVQATTDADAPIEVKTPTQSVGSITDGSLAQVPIRVVIEKDAAPGTYDLDLELEYSYFSNYDTDGPIVEKTVDVERSIELDVRSRPRFDVELVDSDVAIGDSGPVTVSVTNDGDATAENARLELSSGNSGLTFEGSAEAQTNLATLSPGERRNVTVESAVAEGGQQRNYSVSAAIAYEDSAGRAATSTDHRFGVRPAPERSFAVEGVESDLRVDEERTITGQLRNDGAVAVDNVVLQLETPNPNIDVSEPEVALGRLDAGESSDFSFDVSVSDNAQPGDRQFTLTAEYRTQADDRRTSDPLDAQVSIAERRPAFEVTGVDANFEAGSGGILRVDIRNARDRPVEDVSAKLYTNAPLSSGDDEAFVERLDSDETTTVSFALQVGGGALPKVYPAQVDFQYDDADGDTHITDTYQVPVTVNDSDNGGLPIVPIVIGVVLVVAVIAGYAYYRRR
jgi:hypothetical protein